MTKHTEYSALKEEDLIEAVGKMTRQLWFYTKKRYEQDEVMLQKIHKAKIKYQIKQLEKELEQL
jgi:hypothetical protein